MLRTGRIVLRSTPQSYDAVLELCRVPEVETPSRRPLPPEIRQEDSTRKAGSEEATRVHPPIPNVEN